MTPVIDRSRSRFTAPRRVYRLPTDIWWIVTAGIIALVMIILWRGHPAVRLRPSAQGLLSYRLSGWDAHIVAAHFTHRGVSVALVNRRGILWPATTMRPGIVGHVTVTLVGAAYLRWLPGESTTVVQAATLPASPQPLAAPALAQGQSALTIAFNEPVVRVRSHQPSQPVWMLLSITRPARVVHVPLTFSSASQGGAVEVSAKARTRESFGPIRRKPWSRDSRLTATRQGSGQLGPSSVLTVRFSAPIRQPHWTAWHMTPSIPGHWQALSAVEFAFHPSGPAGFGPGASVKLTIPGGKSGPHAISGSVPVHAATLTWTTPPGSILRLQQLLAEAGYLPVSWAATDPGTTRNSRYQAAAIYQPPLGQFHWLYPHLPPQLKSLWSPGQMSIVTQGAIMQFQAANGLPVTGTASPAVWQMLVQNRIKNRRSLWPYSYIAVTESPPETLQVWLGNTLVLTTPTNTGIASVPTYLGTNAIYERLPLQIMRGKNPNGVRYADPVYWVNYFKGGDAVHGFVRAAYGFPQSLGCVEVPPAVAQTIYRDVHYGTLVTVNPVGIPPAPAS